MYPRLERWTFYITKSLKWIQTDEGFGGFHRCKGFKIMRWKTTSSVTLHSMLILKLSHCFPSSNCSLQKMVETKMKRKVSWKKAHKVNSIHGTYTPFVCPISISNPFQHFKMTPLSFSSILTYNFYPFLTKLWRWGPCSLQNKMASRMGILFKMKV